MWPKDAPYAHVAGPFPSLRAAWEAAERAAVDRDQPVDVVVVSAEEWIRVLTVDPAEEDSPLLLATDREGWAWWVGVRPR